ncbi:MAG: response regulator [Candidatus Omnitrophota bacterium]|nr:response regulator [Candidatus Omnitrophota bacterium]
MAKKILFIEDEVDIVTLMQARLVSQGYQMLSAFDGEEGLKMAQEEKPDLILLDKIMPKMDGLEVCQRLKSDPKTKDIPIIIVSASGGKDLPERCQAARADDLIIKPFEPEELLSKIKKFIG